MNESNHEVVTLNKGETKSLIKLSGEGIYYVRVAGEDGRQYFTIIRSTAENIFTDSWFANYFSISINLGVISITQSYWDITFFDVYKVS